MHCFIAFDTMRKCRVHILGTLSPERYRETRATILALVLATDLQQHFEVRTVRRLAS
jgi:hypothetical protein